MGPSPAGLSVRLLGPVEILVDGHVVAFDTRKAVALLAYVAVIRRPTSREALAALLWPEAPGTDARNALRRTLSVLRSGLGGRGLIVDRSAVAVDDGTVEVDLWRFRAALARARGHGHPASDACAACVDALDEALAWDRGPFMEGFALRDSETFDEWQAAEGEAHRRDLAGAFERLARARAAEHRWDLTTEAVRRWLDVDPLHEPAHQMMITALARSGEVAGAIAQYRDLVRTLDRELGVPPLPETADLAEAIRDGMLAPDHAGTASDLATEPGRELTESPAATGSAETLPLVGRDGHVARLMAAITGVGPDGRLLLVEGEAGVGKTRLAEAIVERVRERGGVVLEARTIVGEIAIPFAVIAELIRAGAAERDADARIASMPSTWLADAARLAPLPGVGLPAPGGPSAGTDPYGRLRLMDSLSGVLAALAQGPRGGLIWVDDIDRADASSAEVIAYVARRLHGRSIAVLLSGRFEAADAPEVSAALLLALRDANVQIQLERLGRSDVSTWATRALGAGATADLVDALVAETEGLPLYVAEALASPESIGGAVPGGMLALLRSRIASIDEVGRQVLAAAAVIGRSFDLETVRAAAGRGEEETVEGLEALLRRGLIREVRATGPGDVQYDFTHGRLRDVAYEDTSLARRRLLHGRVADALGRTGSWRRHATRWALVATHATLAGRTEEAAAAHLRAGQHARDVYANPEAREHFEAALALGHPEAAAIHEALGDLLTLMGDYSNALGHFETAEAQGDRSREASIEHRIGLVHARRGDLVRAERHLARASDPLIDDRWAGRLLVDRGAIAFGLGDQPGAEALARRALVTSTDHDDPTGVARSEALLGMLARRSGELAEARVHLQAAIATLDQVDGSASEELSDPGVRIAALNTLALVESDAGSLDTAEALMRDALDRCQRQGDRHRQAALENNLADLLHAQGREAESMEHLKRAVALFAEIGGRPGELEPEVWKLVEW